MTTEYTLYAPLNFNYAAKVRACLQYKRLHYVERSSHPGMAAEIAGAYPCCPVQLTAAGAPLQNCCDIIEELELRHPERPVIPADPVLHLMALVLEIYADEFFLVPDVFDRWVNEKARCWAPDLFPPLDICEPTRGAGAAATDIASAHRGDPAVQAAIDRLCRRLLDRLDEHLSEVPFIFGDHPSLADLVLVNAFYPHLYCGNANPVAAYMREHCASLSTWVDRMHTAAGACSEGSLYVAETLEAVLAEIGPAFTDMASAMLRMGAAVIPPMQAGSLCPQSLGSIDVQIVGAVMRRSVSSYALWKLQRLMLAYRELAPAAQLEADRLLALAGLLEVCQSDPGVTLANSDHRVSVI